MNVSSWVGAVAWRWRAVHFVIAFGLETVRPGFGVVGYASHEFTQWDSPQRKTVQWHLLDFLPAVIAAVIVAFLRRER